MRAGEGAGGAGCADATAMVRERDKAEKKYMSKNIVFFAISKWARHGAPRVDARNRILVRERVL